MIHSFLEYSYLFSITQSNGDHTVRIGGVILLLCFNIYSAALVELQILYVIRLVGVRFMLISERTRLRMSTRMHVR